MRKKRTLHISARLALLMLVGLFSVNILFGGNATPKKSIREKARYFFMKGAIREADGRPDEAYEFYKKAYETDPTYVDGAFAHGSMRLILEHDTFLSDEERDRGMQMVKSMTDAYPADRHTALHYVYIAMASDTVEEAIRVLNQLEKYHPGDASIQIYKSNAYGTLGETDSAIAAIRKYERLEGMSMETAVRKAQFRMMDNDTIGAIGELMELVSAYPNNPEYVSYIGTLYRVLDMPDSAMVYYTKALEMDPGSGMVKASIADIYGERKDSVTYDSLTYEALLSDDLEFESKMRILSLYLQRIIDDKSDTKRSDFLFETIRDQYPHEPEMLAIGARYSAAKKDYKEALRQIEYAIALDGQNPDYIEPHISYLILDDRPVEAMRVYEEAQKNQMPLTVGNTFLYISAAQQANRDDYALNALDSLIRLTSPAVTLNDTAIDLSKLRNLEFIQILMMSNYFQMAGDIYYNMGDLPATFRSYENALTIFPDNDLALNNYAYFLVEKGNALPGSPEFEKAEKMSQQCIELNSNNPSPTYLDTYAWILFKDKKYEEAEKYQRMAVEKDPDSDDVDLFSHFGDILFMNNKPEEALEQWKKALQLDPTNELLQKKVTHKTFFYK